jgi:hypothetical protein
MARPSSTVGPTPDLPLEDITEPERIADLNDFDGIWGDLRTSFDHAHQVLRNWTDDDGVDSLEPALNEAARLIAQTAVTGSPGDIASRTADSHGSAAVDQYLAPVEAAYVDARTAGLSTDGPEWTGVSAIRSALHNLWDTVKAVAGRYWAELSADMRVQGPLNALATRAARGIASLASRAANCLEGRGLQQQTNAASLASLREAYINARGQVRAHAATHEWQRISALWGTVNTLARQTGDPGIRAVVARSADAISDFADALSRRVAQDAQGGVGDVLSSLAGAAERHASTLRGAESGQIPDVSPSLVSAAASSGSALAAARCAQQGVETGPLQARAHEIARMAQARLGEKPRKEAFARNPHGGNGPRGQQGDPMRYRRPAAPQEPARGPRW